MKTPDLNKQNKALNLYFVKKEKIELTDRRESNRSTKIWFKIV
jgi:hypothetical protein